MTPLWLGVAPRVAWVAVGSQSAAGGGALHSGQPRRQCPAHQEIAYDVDAWDIRFEKSPNKTMAPNLVTSKTLVVIISDGWDTGDSHILKAAMEKLQTGAARVIWLNPLLGSAH